MGGEESKERKQRRNGRVEDPPQPHSLYHYQSMTTAWDIIVLTILPHQKQYNSKEEAEDERTSQVSVIHDCLVCLLNRVQDCQCLGGRGVEREKGGLKTEGETKGEERGRRKGGEGGGGNGREEERTKPATYMYI